MSDWIQRLIESKRAHRAKLAALPFEEKIKLLEQLRHRTLLLNAGRKPNAVPMVEPEQFDTSPVLGVAFLSGVRSRHQPSDEATLDTVGQNTRR